MDDTAGKIINVASLAIVDVITSRRLGMLDDASEERRGLVVLTHQAVTKGVAHCKRTKRTHGVGEQRVRSVERIDVAEFRCELCPAGGLDCTACLQREVVEVTLPLIGGETTLLKEAAEIAVCADIVETMVMDTDVGDVRRHEA